MHNYEDIVPIFDAVLHVLNGECGDGDASILCKYIKVSEVVQYLERYFTEKKIDRFRVKHSFSEDHVLFSNGSNENFSIQLPKDRQNLPPWMSIIIEI